MPHSLELGTLCILTSTNSTAGTGFLISSELIVTCAHVIEQAGERIRVRFTGRDEVLDARVLPDYWRAPDAGDIAFLQLESTVGVSRLPLGATEHSLSGNTFLAFGYPSVGDVEGVYARGEILGFVKENNQRLLQVRSEELNQGHSGAPILDEKRGVVVGMVVSVYKSDASGKLRDTAFAIPTETLWQVCPEIHPSETAPYVGLETFTDETARFFFGREALTEKLLGALRGGCRLLAVFGPSGSGKSSVIRAGFLPALKSGYLAGSQNWAQITIRPANNPYEQIKQAGLDRIDIEAYFKNHIHFERVLLFIDQLEELFTFCHDAMRERFVKDLAAALENSRLIVILSMRDDFYSVFNAQASLLAESGHLKIENVPGTLKRAELTAMIELPAEMVGLKIEEGLPELIIKDVTSGSEARSSTLPLLEFALTQLWEKRRDGQLTHDTYQSIGGVTGSLARWADDAYSELSKADQLLAEGLLLSLVHLGEETHGLPDMRRRRDLVELGRSENIRRIIKHFTDRRLIITSGGSVELVHDALVHEWSRLQGWMKNDRDNLRLRDGVSEAAIEWDSGGREENLLSHRGARLELALTMSTNPRYPLNNIERAYLDRCVGVREREKAAVARRRWLAFTGVSVAVIVIFAILVGWGITSTISANENATQVAIAQTSQANARESERIAQEQSRFALARQLANQAASFHTVDPQLSLLLAIEAVNTTYVSDKTTTLEAETVLRGLLAGAYRPIYLGVQGLGLVDFAFSPDERYLALVDQNGSLGIWETSTGKQKQFFSDIAAVRNNLLFSSDSNYLLYSDPRGNILVQDIEEGEFIQEMENKSPLRLLTFRPGSKQIVASGEDGTLNIWDWKTGELISSTDYDMGAQKIIFKPDGSEAVILAVNGAVRHWNPSSKALAYIQQPNDSVSDVIVDPEWTSMLVIEADHTAIEWDLANNTVIRTISEPSAIFYTYTNTGLSAVIAQRNGISTLVDMETGTRQATLTGEDVFGAQPYLIMTDRASGLLLVARDASRADLWRIENGGFIRSLSDYEGQIVSAEIAPSGRYLLTTHSDGVVRLWDATSEPDRILLQGLTEGAWRIVFDNSGKYVAAAGQEGVAIVWETSSGKIISRMTGHELGEPGAPGINNLTFNPKADLLATAGWDKTARIWNTLTGELIFVLPHSSYLSDVRFHPVGDFLASSDVSGVYLWNISNGELVAKWDTPGAVNRLAFSNDGKMLAAAGVNNTSWVWDLSTRQKIADLPTNGAMIDIKFNVSGDQLATVGFGGNASVWDTKTWEVITHLPGMEKTMWSFAYSFDGSKIYTGSDDGKVRIWDSNSGKLLKSFQGHTGRIWSVSSNPKKDVFATGGEDGTIRIWDGTTGAALSILPDAVGAKSVFNFNLGEINLNQSVTLDRGVISVTSDEKGLTFFSSDKQMVFPWVMEILFDPEGTHIASANIDGTANIYISDIDMLLDLARARVERTLTCQERVQFLYEELSCEAVGTPAP